MKRLIAALSFLLSASAFADSVTLHVIRSPGLEWTSPRRLAKTTINLSIGSKPYPIGHVTVEMNCSGTTTHTGMTQKYANEDNRIIKREKYGMGVLFYSFAGLFEKQDWIRNSIRNFTGSDRYAAIRFEVSPESCAKMQEFYTTIANEGLHQWYGMMSRPDHGEGGGCSAYAVSYLKAAGLLEDWVIQEWARYVRVPMESIGGPVNGGRTLGIPYLMFRSPQRWSRENEAHLPLFLYDPDLMYSWATKVFQSANDDPSWGPVKKQRIGARSILIEIDRTTKLPTDAPLFVTKTSDPRAVEQNPEIVRTMWLDEIEIWKKKHQPLQ